MREVEQHSAIKTEEQDAEFQRLLENDEAISEALQVGRLERLIKTRKPNDGNE